MKRRMRMAVRGDRGVGRGRRARRQRRSPGGAGSLAARARRHVRRHALLSTDEGRAGGSNLVHDDYPIFPCGRWLCRYIGDQRKEAQRGKEAHKATGLYSGWRWLSVDTQMQVTPLEKTEGPDGEPRRAPASSVHSFAYLGSVVLTDKHFPKSWAWGGIGCFPWAGKSRLLFPGSPLSGTETHMPACICPIVVLSWFGVEGPRKRAFPASNSACPRGQEAFNRACATAPRVFGRVAEAYKVSGPFLGTRPGANRPG